MFIGKVESKLVSYYFFILIPQNVMINSRVSTLTGTAKCRAVPRAIVLTKHGCVPRAVLVAEVTRKSSHHPVCVAKICLVGVLRWGAGISTAYWRESEILKKGGLIMHKQNKPLDSTQDRHFTLVAFDTR